MQKPNRNGFCICLIVVVTMLGGNAMNVTEEIQIVSRDEWKAKDPKVIEYNVRPVPYVIIHHTFQPPACNTPQECEEAMRWMQDFHQINRTWWDIGYNFAVGGDGRVYEGRGWERVGAHSLHYNNISIGIAVIGDWSVDVPPKEQVLKVRQLIEVGVREGHISHVYRLVAHRLVRKGTTCPGDRLFEEMQSWYHYDPAPNSTNLYREWAGINITRAGLNIVRAGLTTAGAVLTTEKAELRTAGAVLTTEKTALPEQTVAKVPVNNDNVTVHTDNLVVGTMVGSARADAAAAEKQETVTEPTKSVPPHEEHRLEKRGGFLDKLFH